MHICSLITYCDSLLRLVVVHLSAITVLCPCCTAFLYNASSMLCCCPALLFCAHYVPTVRYAVLSCVCASFVIVLCFVAVLCCARANVSLILCWCAALLFCACYVPVLCFDWLLRCASVFLCSCVILLRCVCVSCVILLCFVAVLCCARALAVQCCCALLC